MSEKRDERPSLRQFDAYTDRNGQDLGQDSPLDLARPADLQRALTQDPSWQAETARLASGQQRLDSIAGGSVATSEATAAETPPETIERLGDATLTPEDQDATAQAVSRMRRAGEA